MIRRMFGAVPGGVGREEALGKAAEALGLPLSAAGLAVGLLAPVVGGGVTVGGLLVHATRSAAAASRARTLRTPEPVVTSRSYKPSRAGQ